MSETNRPSIGMLGFGELGRSFARGFARAGLAAPKVFDPGLRQTPDDVTDAVFVPEAGDLDGADVIISAVTPAKALEAATSLRGRIRSPAWFLDINAVRAQVKQHAAAALVGSNLRYIDGAVLGVPAAEQHAVPIFISGTDADSFRQLLQPWGFNLRVSGDQVGDAASIKIIRSVLVKGMEALFVEALVTAAHHGVVDQVLESVDALVGNRSMADVARAMLNGHLRHAERRMFEVQSSRAEVAACGLDPIMSEAIVELLRRTTSRITPVTSGDGLIPLPDAIATLAAGLAELAETTK